jgi:hypothetical protein
VCAVADGGPPRLEDVGSTWIEEVATGTVEVLCLPVGGVLRCVVGLGELSVLLVPDTVIEVEVVSVEVVGVVSVEVVSVEVVGVVSVDVVSVEVVGVVSVEVVSVEVFSVEVVSVEVVSVVEEVVDDGGVVCVVVEPSMQCEITNCPSQSVGTSAVASVTACPPLSEATYFPVFPGELSNGAMVLVLSDRDTVMLDGGVSIWVITKYAPAAPSQPL